MYFDTREILRENFLLNFAVSERGGGKTFNTIKDCVTDFLETGEQFVYIRRTKIELEECETKIMSAYHPNGFFNENTFTVKDKTVYTDGKVNGFLIPLSTAFQLKSVSYPKVTKIIFDEFISENGKYLKNEVEKFLSVVETIARMREVQIIMLGNQITKYNPYYVYFNIKPSEAKFTRYRSKSILIYQFDSPEFREAKLKTRFGKLISGTKYGNYLLNNESINDDYSFVDRLEGVQKRAVANMIIEGNNIVVYDCFLEDKSHLYFAKRSSVKDIYTINYDKMLAENSTIEATKNSPLTIKVTSYINNSRIRFKDLPTKNLIENFIFT